MTDRLTDEALARLAEYAEEEGSVLASVYKHTLRDLVAEVRASRAASAPAPEGHAHDPDEECESYHAQVHDVIADLASGRALTCPTCGPENQATCVGYGERPENLSFGCDECCGHGNEDGWCVPLSPRGSDSKGRA